MHVLITQTILVPQKRLIQLQIETKPVQTGYFYLFLIEWMTIFLDGEFFWMAVRTAETNRPLIQMVKIANVSFIIKYWRGKRELLIALKIYMGSLLLGVHHNNFFSTIVKLITLTVFSNVTNLNLKSFKS